ncbi:hypothetical protein NM688_g5764 [Phlebia brevispora]|uniref:Uncharacterized protein n=1 Tax=Phlebia brevispora TaxID=194682 RepID=A0ACC1SQ69_9APHY|nr:hypothetical protein NM688_g5764 [Phlebia brevispora]
MHVKVWEMAKHLYEEFGRNKEHAAAAEGTSKKAHELSFKLRAQWAGMSKEEQVEITKDVMIELQEQREMKKYVVQNVPIAAFHDVKSTIQCIEDEITSLYARTGMEFIVLGMCTNDEHFNQPFSFMTSDRVEEYFLYSTGKNIAQFMEAACPDVINKMAYKEFDEHVTRKYGIIIENWPLHTFCAPGYIGSRLELTALINAWTNNVYFEVKRTAATAAPSMVSATQQTPGGASSITAPVTGSGTNPTTVPARDGPLVLTGLPFSDPTTGSSASTGLFTVMTNVLVQKKQWKQCSDKGVKRGSNTRGKKKTTQGHDASVLKSR